MKFASEDLKHEHEGILAGLLILGKMAALLKKNVKVNLEDMKEIVSFLKMFVDTCHHGKEEGILFPEMERVGIPKEKGLIAQMLAEHVEGRRYIAIMSDSFQSPFRAEAFRQAAEAYVVLLRRHIDKENRKLFPLGDKKIPAGIQADLLARFEAHETRVMGAGTHERLHQILKDLKHKYLP